MLKKTIKMLRQNNYEIQLLLDYQKNNADIHKNLYNVFYWDTPIKLIEGTEDDAWRIALEHLVDNA